MRKLVIDAAALARNLDRLRRAASARIIGVVKGAENAVLQLDKLVGDFVEKHMEG